MEIPRKSVLVAVLAWFAILLPPAQAQFTQTGSKLVGTGSAGSAQQGSSVALSADGTTAIVGGPADNGGGTQGIGAAWVYTRSNGQWAQQGPKLSGSDRVPPSLQGNSVAISADGNTALVGAWVDNNTTGAAWVFTRTNGVWSQQGSKLVPSDAMPAWFAGISVALSGDGNTALVGEIPREDSVFPAAWVFKRTGGAWIQQVRLSTPGGSPNSCLVALSADGKTALVGTYSDDNISGGAWAFSFANGVWSQQGNKLVGSGGVGLTYQGSALALSGDGNTALMGGYADNSTIGATWVFTRNNGVWSQQGNKLVGSGGAGTRNAQGMSVALSGDGNTALVGGFRDNGNVGAGWIFTRKNGVWSQQGSKLVGTGAVGNAAQGIAVALSADASTALLGGYIDSNGAGAVWAFTQPGPATHFTVVAPASATAPFDFTVTAMDASNNTATGYNGTVHFTSTDSAATLPADTTLSNGTGTFSATLRTAGNRTITATDSANSSITGSSGAIAVGPVSPPAPGGVSPASGSALNQAMIFTFSDPRGYQDLGVLNILVNNFLDGRHACYLAYSRPSNVLYLVDDAGGLLPGSVLTSAGSTSNSQCTVSWGSSAVAGSGNSLTLTLAFTFTGTFGGNRIVYLAARDVAENNSGWQAVGVWNVPSPQPPASTIAVGSMTPARGSAVAGTPLSLTFTLSAASGAADIGIVNVLVNSFIDGRQACYLAYVASTNTLLLVDDAGDAGGPYAGSMVLGGSEGPIQNAQCSVSGVGSSAVATGNLLTLTLNITFKAPLAGNRVLWVAGRDRADGNNTDWQAVGTWTVI